MRRLVGFGLAYGAAVAALQVVMGALGEGILTGVSRRMLGYGLRLATGLLFVGTGGSLLYYFLSTYGGLL